VLPIIPLLKILHRESRVDSINAHPVMGNMSHLVCKFGKSSLMAFFEKEGSNACVARVCGLFTKNIF